MEVRRGVFINLADTVIEPTREWLEKGPVEKFTPKAPDGTVRSLSTVRRIRSSAVTKLYGQGKVSMEFVFVAIWYRQCYEAAGIEGRYKTSNMSGMNFGSGGGAGQSQHPMAQHESEADMREAVRSVRKYLGERHAKVFEAIAILDLPLREAARVAKCSNGSILSRFRDACAGVIEWCEKAGVDLERFAKKQAGG